MIIIGYQGIGKSSLSEVENGCIDLESSNFFLDGTRDENWYKIYAKIAVNLSKQGYVVFTSSHRVVREELSNYDETKFIITPSLELKEEWIKKLKERYERTNLEKDYKAYMNAKCSYNEGVSELIKDSSYRSVEILDMNYSLKNIIDELKMLSEVK